MSTTVEFRNITSGVDAKLIASGASDDLTAQSGYPQRVCRGIFYSGATTVVTAGGNSIALPDAGQYVFLPLQCETLTSGTNVVIIW